MSDLPFHSLAPYLKATFGREVYRVALDAGSTCPNRDGSKGFGGCTYCDVEGSGTGEMKSGTELAQQLSDGVARVRKRHPEAGVIAYFQSYSNTYVSQARLAEVLSVLEGSLGDPVVAVSIATRPDTLPPAALELLSQLNQRIPVWLEIGLEVADDGLLDSIRRFHTVDDFLVAVERSRQAGLEVIGHAILGIPGDDREGARRTARCLAESGVRGVKVHNLMILKRTQMEHQWRQGLIDVLSAEDYVQWLADFVERLHPDQILHRMTGDSPIEERLAPHWGVSVNGIRHQLGQELARRGTRQGALFEVRAGRGPA